MISIIFFIFIQFICIFVNGSNLRCLNIKEHIPWNRKFPYKNTLIPLIIEVSPRPSHRIVSQIISILLRERLGYNVNFTYQNWDPTNEVIRRFSCQYNQCRDGSPISHINLEVWKSPGYTFNDDDKQHVVDCGPLGPIVRKGLFVNSNEVENIFYKEKKVIDHWKFLKKNAQFCPQKSQSCFSIYKSNFTEMEKEFNDISRDLFQDTVISYLSNFPITNQSHTDIFLDWYPNVLTVKRNFTRLLFPDCSDPIVDSACNFEVSQINKVVWRHVKDHADRAFELIRDFMLDQDEYVNLLKNVNEDSDNEYFRVACDWVKNNKQKWYEWTTGWNVKENMYLPVLISDYGLWKASKTFNSSMYGIKNLNNLFFNNTYYQLVPIIRELPCDVDTILNDYLNIIEKYGEKILGFIVCLCPQTFSNVIKLADIQNRIIISSSIDSTNNGNISQYRHFFNTFPNMVNYNLVLINLLQKLNWNRVVILANDMNFVNTNLLNKGNITILDKRYVEESKLTYNDTYKFLEHAKRVHKASIFIIDYYNYGTQTVMCAAGHLGMTLDNSYAFILNPFVHPHWWENSTITQCPKNTAFISKEYFVIIHDTTTEHRDNYIKNSPMKFNYLAQLTHDAILYMGVSFHKLLREMPSAFLTWQAPEVSEKYIDILLNHEQFFIGLNNVYKRKIFNRKHHRNGIWQFQQIASFHQNIIITMSLFNWEISFETGLPIRMNKTNHDIYRGKSKRPLIDYNQESNCPVEPLRKILNWSCTATLLLINLLSIFIIIIIFTGALLFYYFRQSVQVEDRNKKPFEDLCAELTEIDIRSTDVIINLQVGKGAFGIVYGGEAKQKNHWESVAIKLIKKEADYQGKIDFLTEAKLMRNLDHPNIVKLIGICLNPPKPVIYLVMELLVNGDLEDHLLSHRITAHKDPMNKLVCPTLLTRFVKDITSGADYLHQNNLLHRDLACRNCFLSEDYMIKIGDFGLTRHISDSHESQYYRVSRHFVLPARWMPPEAVQFGYFSIQSDIWSLGVIIFEIATFCSRPYYNVSDEEVPELVKRNTMPLVTYLPENCKGSHVYKLIEKCCQYKRDERPESMKNIITYLDENPECIKPYLTIDPPQHHIVNIGNCDKNWNQMDSSQRADSLASGGLSRFKSSSRSRNSAGNWGIYTDSQNNFESFFLNESEVEFKENSEQIPFMPSEDEFLTLSHSTNRIGSKKRHKSGNKKSSSNLNSSKSRSSDFMAKKIEDDQEPSYVSCPDQDNIHHILGDMDPQDFPLNDEVVNFLRSASGNERSISSGKRIKSFRNGKIVYSGSSRNRKVHMNNTSNKNKSKLLSMHGSGMKRFNDRNGLHHELVAPLLFDRPGNVSIQPKKSKGFKSMMNDEIC